MPKFAIAFVAPSKGGTLRHKIVEGPDQETALKAFFSSEACEYYTNDDQGYHYFREDFFDESVPSGSMVPCG